MKFISCAELLPVMPGEYSDEKFVVRVFEFGMDKPEYVFATCWISSDFPLIPKWYIGIDPPMMIAQTVTHWLGIIDET